MLKNSSSVRYFQQCATYRHEPTVLNFEPEFWIWNYMLLQTMLLTKINSHYVNNHTGNVLSDLWNASSSHHISNFGPFLFCHTPGVDWHLLPLPHHLEKRFFFDIFIGNLPVKSRISLTYNLFCIKVPNLMTTLNDYSVFTNLIPPITASDIRGNVSLGYTQTTLLELFFYLN